MPDILLDAGDLLAMCYGQGSEKGCNVQEKSVTTRPDQHSDKRQYNASVTERWQVRLYDDDDDE